MFLVEAGVGEFPLTNAKRVVLPNGATLILLEDHRLPIVVANLSIRDVASLSGYSEAAVRGWEKGYIRPPVIHREILSALEDANPA